MLIQSNLPVESMTAFSTRLPKFLSGAPGLASQNYLGAPPSVPSLAEINTESALPQPVYQLSLSAAAVNTGDLSSSASAAGWRIFLGDPRGKVVLGRVVQIPPAQTWRLTALFFGARVVDALFASRDLEALPEVKDADYTLRVLTVPGLCFEAFWLVPQTEGRTDFIKPFPQGNDQLVKVLDGNFLYEATAFLSLIKPLAARLLMTDPYRGA